MSSLSVCHIIFSLTADSWGLAIRRVRLQVDAVHPESFSGNHRPQSLCPQCWPVITLLLYAHSQQWFMLEADSVFMCACAVCVDTMPWHHGAGWRGWGSLCGKQWRWLWSGRLLCCSQSPRHWRSTWWSCRTEATSCACVCCTQSRPPALWR